MRATRYITSHNKRLNLFRIRMAKRFSDGGVWSSIFNMFSRLCAVAFYQLEKLNKVQTTNEIIQTIHIRK